MLTAALIWVATEQSSKKAAQNLGEVFARYLILLFYTAYVKQSQAASGSQPVHTRQVKETARQVPRHCCLQKSKLAIEEMSGTFYDPNKPPSAQVWLALGENERIRLAQSFHVSARIKAPNLKAHAVIHVVVENQIAMGFGPSCRAVERLQSEGLSRHDAVHAIGSIVAAHAYELMNAKQVDPGASQRLLNDAIDGLTAQGWNASNEGRNTDG